MFNKRMQINDDEFQCQTILKTNKIIYNEVFAQVPEQLIF